MKKFFLKGIAFSVLVLFSGCSTQFMQLQNKEDASNEVKKETQCTLAKIEENLTPVEKKRLYENIKLELSYLMDNAMAQEENGYIKKAKYNYNLVNFYSDEEQIPALKFQKLDQLISQNSKFFYEQASIASSNDNTLLTLVELNNMMKNDPSYENGKMIFDNLLEEYGVKEFLKPRITNLERLLTDDSYEISYIQELDLAIEELAKFNHLNPLVEQGFKKLDTKRETLLEDAIAMFEQNMYTQAKEKFLFIQDIYTVDKTSSFYLDQIDNIQKQIQLRKALAKQQKQNIQKQKQTMQKQRQNMQIKREKEEKLVAIFEANKYDEAIDAANKLLKEYKGNQIALEILRKSKLQLENQVPQLILKGEEAYQNQELNKAVNFLEQALRIDQENIAAKALIKRIKAQIKTLEELQF